MTTWSIDEKRKLLMSLRKHGAADLEKINSDLSSKSITEIRCMLEKYKNLAYNKWLTIESKKNNDVKVRNWIEIMKRLNLKQKGPVHDVIPRVLKYIALYEKRFNKSDINLSDCYKVLADICNGRPSKDLDVRTNYFLHKCLATLATTLKKQSVTQSRNFLVKLENFERISNEQNEYMINPFNVPDALLMPNEIDKYTKILDSVTSDND